MQTINAAAVVAEKSEPCCVCGQEVRRNRNGIPYPGHFAGRRHRAALAAHIAQKQASDTEQA